MYRFSVHGDQFGERGDNVPSLCPWLAPRCHGTLVGMEISVGDCRRLNGMCVRLQERVA